ncbi:hypothetical protein K2173_025519 [Erythroxylum novogranatense]|uniref:RSE1/DDB1/CPSF1 C-terminal domain-containing protein n=1 Tax=Erythroxylum novogranatense TaxID=1862640 RepID=A0AAV8T9Y6_9ROSI|nr:hypothetical protein K2173_025519 [Erythroxylum novogranatense]
MGFLHQVLDARTAVTSCLLELQDNEPAFSVCTVNCHNKEHGTLLAVGTTKFVDEGKGLELLHRAQVEGVPIALCQLQGRLLAGIGPVLRLYDLGKKRLLRKCENKLFPNTIVSVHTYHDRIYVEDNQEDVSDEIEEDPPGAKIKWEQGKLNGSPTKVEEIVHFRVGDVVTSLQKAFLIPGGGECIIYGTVMGSVGSLLPSTSRDDVDFFSHLEMHLRKIADELDRTPGEMLKKLEEVGNKII